MSHRGRITVLHRPLPRDPGALLTVTATLEDLGYTVHETDDAPLALGPEDTVWILGNAVWFPRFCSQLLAIPAAARPFVVLWYSEPLPAPRAAALPRPRLHLREIAKIALRDRRTTDVYSNARRLRSLARQGLPHLLVASTPARCEYLAERGIAAEYVPLGYDRAEHGGLLALDRDIDVLFLGIPVPRRKRLLRRLEQRGVAVRRAGDWFDPATWGEARNRLLNRTKIFLNLARHPGELPGLRFILGMASQTLIVSEPIYSPGPYVPGRHLVSAPIEEMPAVIGHYLEHTKERQRIAAAGHRLVTRELTMRHSVERILALVEERRAAQRTSGAVAAAGAAR